MMASSARHLILLAFVAVLAVATTPRVGAWGGGRLFFSKTTRPTVDDSEKVSAAAGTTADVANPNGATAFSRPSTGGSGRGYGLYGRPEESFPPGYFRRGVHRNAEKLTTTGTANDAAAVPAGGRAEDNGSGRGRAPWTYANNHVVPTTTTTGSSTEETVPATTTGGGGERADPTAEEDNGSGWGRPRRYYGQATAADGATEEQRRYYGMSDTRMYQNGRYYYDVGAGRYGYGRESNPVRTRPEEFAGGDGRGRYYGGGNAAEVYQQYGNGDQLGNGFQEEEDRNGRYIP